ncbi:hypothetical protein CALCODRAFT_324596 [Calocera cornea HHB12733]|uniref:Uncharacterized protein n=1 Tax=Calocera cornea HHB12733 TaxID=1353952 RepID=A0A165F4E7_9BASI|nr:hypothetical protein CALCODRAFT_324596 [Calocera cornea HHB12733]
MDGSKPLEVSKLCSRSKQTKGCKAGSRSRLRRGLKYPSGTLTRRKQTEKQGEYRTFQTEAKGPASPASLSSAPSPSLSADTGGRDGRPQTLPSAAGMPGGTTHAPSPSVPPSTHAPRASRYGGGTGRTAVPQVGATTLRYARRSWLAINEEPVGYALDDPSRRL